MNTYKGIQGAPLRISGSWSDPAHPGCTRKIVLQGNKAFINGADEDAFNGFTFQEKSGLNS